jgi:hypothetical protein
MHTIASKFFRLHSNLSGRRSSGLRRLALLAAGLAVAFANAATGPLAMAETINAERFRLDIATNLNWLDNRNDPVVNTLSAQQNYFDRLVAEANPFLRITNLSESDSLVGANLDLSTSDARISDVEWVETPGSANWKWDESSLVCQLQFNDAVLPGKSASMRLFTSARADGYTLNQNLFQPLGGLSANNKQYGTVTLLVGQELLSQEVQFTRSGDPVGVSLLEPAPTYNLATIPRVPIYAGGREIGFQTAAAIQPVPEPAGIVSVVAAGVALAAFRIGGRRKTGKV